MIKLGEFLEINVEGYLFGDLRKMQKAEVGYPLLVTTFAGIELFGALLSESEFDPYREGMNYFLSYWKTLLYPSLRDSETIGKVLYKLARHGIAHSFVVKGPISVVFTQADVHLARDSNDVIYVDATTLAQDLMDSFNARAMPLITGTTGVVNSTSVESRLKEMETKYSIQATLCDVSIFRLITAAANSEPENHGQSGATGPTFPPSAVPP